MTGTVLCHLRDVPDGGSTALTVEFEDEDLRLMLIRRGDRVYAYENTCPHAGLPLDFVEGRFLNRERTHILCTNHGALFRIEDGACVAGPCRGRALEPVAVLVGPDGEILIRGA